MVHITGTPPIHYRSLFEVSQLVKQKEISPVELTKIMLERINKLDQRLNSYAHILPQASMAAAKKAEKEVLKGNYLGPLHGVPVAVKDLCYTKGIPTTGGLKVLSGFRPDYDATVVSKLKQAGGILLGKLNLTEGAVGGYHKQFKIPVNPWGIDLWPGGSSSGSGVATAAGLCYGSLGTDTGGSIRFPSMANGIVGLKPTYGRVSRFGILPLAESMDHVGPMARTVRDTAILLEAIAGSDPHDPSSLSAVLKVQFNQEEPSLHEVRIGLDEAYAFREIDHDLIHSVQCALEVLQQLGAEIVPVKVPECSELRDIWKIICTSEAAQAHAKTYPSRADEYGAFFGDFLEFGNRVSKVRYEKAMAKRRKFSSSFCTMLNSVDALITPGSGIPWKVPAGLLYQSMPVIRGKMNPFTYFQFTIPGNFSGTPALSLPCGMSTMGVPHSFQLIGKPLSEAVLCHLGMEYQKATNWHQYHPQI